MAQPSVLFLHPLRVYLLKKPSGGAAGGGAEWDRTRSDRTQARSDRTHARSERTQGPSDHVHARSERTQGCGASAARHRTDGTGECAAGGEGERKAADGGGNAATPG